MVDVIAGFLNDSPAELSVQLRLHARRGVNERDFIAFLQQAPHEDEGSREQLGKGLATLTEKGLIRKWHDRELLAGDRHNDEIADALNAADLAAIFLISRARRPQHLGTDQAGCSWALRLVGLMVR